MPKEKFGISVDEGIVQQVNELADGWIIFNPEDAKLSKRSPQRTYNPMLTTLNESASWSFTEDKELSNRIQFRVPSARCSQKVS